MYRAVMEEVVRFLEKCHRSLDTIQSEPISRSKSVHHVEKDDTDNASTLRARSSTNLIDCPRLATRPESMICTAPSGFYDDFRNFAWWV